MTSGAREVHHRRALRVCFNFINHYPALSNPTLACLMFLQPF